MHEQWVQIGYILSENICDTNEKEQSWYAFPFGRAKEQDKDWAEGVMLLSPLEKKQEIFYAEILTLK